MRKLYPCASIWLPSVDLLGYKKDEEDGEKLFTLMAYVKSQETIMDEIRVTPILLAYSITEEEAKTYVREFHEWKEKLAKQFNEICETIEEKKEENALINVTINAETRDVDAIVRKAINATMDGLLSGLSRMGL